MAEVSIVGFVFGSLGFIVTIRNAVERLILDADAFRIQTEILIPLSGRLDLLSIHLKGWQSFWHIYDGTPIEIFGSYWGDRGSKEIRKLLSYVHSQFEKVEAEFVSKYGHVLDDPSRREIGPTSSSVAYSKDEEQELLKIRTQSYAQKKKCTQRFNTALFTGSTFHKHLDNLEVSVKLLQDISQARFVEYVCAYSEAEWKDRVEFTAARGHLTNLAGHSSITSEILRNLVENSENHNIDFYLDHGASAEQRQRQVFKFARESNIPYYFCISSRYLSSEVSTLRIKCQKTEKSSSSNISWNPSLQHVLQKLCCTENTSAVLSAYFRTAEDAPGFVVSRCHLPQQISENLRSFMVSTQSDFAENLHGEFSRAERTRLAYELAECALLFLRTEWFSELCSCCIFRLENNDMRACFTVRVNRLSHVDHVDPQTGKPCRQTQWCEEELRKMHIRRLGVLLTEIAIGSPIFEVAFNAPENDVEIDFDVGIGESGPIRVAHHKNILRRVGRESGEDFMDAVGCCLKQGIAPRDVVQADLESFYDHVVEP